MSLVEDLDFVDIDVLHQTNGSLAHQLMLMILGTMEDHKDHADEVFLVYDLF